MTRKVRVGFIGLGKMGSLMSKRLLDAGYQMIVYDVFIEKARELGVLGAQVADSAKAVAREADVTLLSIPGDPELIEVCLGAKGVLEGAKPDTTLVDLSTVTPVASAQVARVAEQKGVKYLRAPVSGSTTLAAKGQISIFVSGDKAAYQACEAIFNELAKSVTYVGPKEEAKYLKLLINMMIATSAQMMAEALTFGERANIDWKTMLDVISQSAVASPLIGYKIKPLLERDFTPAFTVKQMEKDVDYALETGRQMGVAMPLTSLVRQFLAAAEATGKGNMDFFSLLLLMEEMAGINKQA
jgi:3-hydroxyisobutyrate dehydrogenase-like beta-hydroxyacid dehydrogenase